MSVWGVTLGDVTTNSLLSYLAVTIVLFGISLGGQSTFEDQKHQERVRRSVGAVGVLMAVAALVLTTFAVGATFSDVRRIPALVVILPAAATCWLLGMEVGRFVVPDHETQLTGTAASLSKAEDRLRRVESSIPEAASVKPPLWIILGHAFAFSVIAELAIEQKSENTWVIACVTFVGMAMGLIVFTQLGAGSLGVESQLAAFGMCAMAFILYAVLLSMFNIIALFTSEAPVECIAVLYGAELLVPILCSHLWRMLPEALFTASLSGAMAWVFRNDSLRTVRNLTRRLNDLERLRATAAPKGLRERLRAAGRTFVS
ncbi:hypothetical protein B5P20_11420 [Clavibacter sepedonicus]|nr:hypothetical protein B5P20_11420 [Clavibacter sepedonicus]